MSEITVVIPTSPVPCHPSTEIIEEVIHSIRRQLPDAPIIIACDGVRPELEHRREQYKEYVLQLAHIKDAGQLVCYIFEQHMHQAGLLKAVIDDIKTPLLFFCEHDTPIDDKPIDWEAIESLLLDGDANTVRLYWHETIHPEHVHLMRKPFLYHGVEFVPTTQWSSWPHISRVDFYKRILIEHFATNDKVMVETTMYSPVLTFPWEHYRTVIYTPWSHGGSVRFHHLNARVDKDGTRDFGDW